MTDFKKYKWMYIRLTTNRDNKWLSILRRSRSFILLLYWNDFLLQDEKLNVEIFI